MGACVSEYTLEFFSLLNAKGNKEFIQWCMKERLIASNYECPKCNERMGLYKQKSVVLDGFEWKCREKGVNNVCRSIRKNSWFSKSKLSMYDILRVTKICFGRCMKNYVVIFYFKYI
ncbi:hypothetical protein X975_01308, partial [Stegodyphus mimosarum]